MPVPIYRGETETSIPSPRTQVLPRQKIIIKEDCDQANANTKNSVLRGSEVKSWLTIATKDFLCAMELCEYGLDVR